MDTATSIPTLLHVVSLKKEIVSSSTFLFYHVRRSDITRILPLWQKLLANVLNFNHAERHISI